MHDSKTTCRAFVLLNNISCVSNHRAGVRTYVSDVSVPQGLQHPHPRQKPIRDRRPGWCSMQQWNFHAYKTTIEAAGASSELSNSAPTHGATTPRRENESDLRLTTLQPKHYSVIEDLWRELEQWSVACVILELFFFFLCRWKFAWKGTLDFVVLDGSVIMICILGFVWINRSF